ncbi:MAG: hypothetical protein ACLQCU_15435 [Acidimicrobiales bacterium]
MDAHAGSLFAPCLGTFPAVGEVDKAPTGEEVVPRIGHDAFHPRLSVGVATRAASITKPRAWPYSRNVSLKRGAVFCSGRANHHDVVDVTVVEGAARRDNDVIITSNESHVRSQAGLDLARMQPVS